MLRSLALLLTILLPAAATADPGDHPVPMWLVEGEQNRIYLLGSVHMLRKTDYPLPSAIEAAYQEADSLVMEIDMDDLDPAATQALVTRLGVIHDDGTLHDLMGADLYEQAQISALAMDIPLEMLAKSEPWLAAITIEQLALNRIGFNPMYGIEMHLLEKAVQDGKEISGFESIEEQLNFLDGLSLDAQRDLLLQTLDESIDLQAEMSGLIDAWHHGDLQFLEEEMLGEMAQYPELYRALIVDRNRRWVDAIDTMLDDEEDYLIVVGALHLIGNDGVPKMLSSRGLSVTQMRQSAN
jgi:uncharacterized protein YbaP (TraB family)